MLLTTGTPPTIEEFELVAAEYLTNLDAAPATVRRKLAALKSYGKWLGLKDFMAGYQSTPVPPAVPHPIPEGVDGVVAMINVCRKEHHRALVSLSGLCGLRISEILRVQARDFSFYDDGTIKVRVLGKGRKQRDVNVGMYAWATLAPSYYIVKDLEDDRLVPLSDRAARRTFTRISQRAGLASHTTHDGRATFATEAYYKSGGDIVAVQQLLGHSNLETTRGYTQASDESLARAVDFTPHV